MSKKRKLISILSIILVALILMLLLTTKPNNPKAESVQLTNPMATVDQTTIQVKFNRDLNSKEQKNINLKLSPQTNFNLDWQSDHEVLITPQSDLTPETEYVTTIFYKTSLLNSFKFTSSRYTASEWEYFAKQQTQDDLTSAEAIKAVHQQYPWYDKIPIETEDYRIIYDFEKNSFRIRLLTSSSDAIKQQALNKIQDIGADINTYGYYFIEPSSGFQQLLP